jgi:hypothetical protein
MLTEERLQEIHDTIQLQISKQSHEKQVQYTLFYESIPPILSIPKPCIPKALIPSQLIAIQKYINQLDYNFLGDPFFVIKKSYSVHRLCKIAMDMISKGLPIKCLEATVLGIYMTMHLKELERIPLAFKSLCDGRIYRHIVLVIKHNEKWGALGLSRRNDLMDKSIGFNVFLA